MPPARAIAMAIALSVTVSIAAETSGTLSAMPRVNRDAVVTSFGCTVEWRGARSTSSNVRAGISRTRAIPDRAGCLMCDGPLPGETGTAGRDSVRVVVAMAKARNRAKRNPVAEGRETAPYTAIFFSRFFIRLGRKNDAATSTPCRFCRLSAETGPCQCDATTAAPALAISRSMASISR